MWILLVIILGQPYQVERIEILEFFQREAKCNSERDRAVTLGLPKNMNIGCLQIKGTGLADGRRKNRTL